MPFNDQCSSRLEIERVFLAVDDHGVTFVDEARAECHILGERFCHRGAVRVCWRIDAPNLHVVDFVVLFVNCYLPPKLVARCGQIA